METRFAFLVELDRDLRGAAARERLALEEAERRDADGGPSTSRGSARVPQRRKTWLMAVAASISVLVLAGSIGFVATEGSPLPAGGGEAAARGVDERSADSWAGYLGPALDQPSFVPEERAAGAGGRRDLSKIVRDGRIGIVVDDGRFTNARAAVDRIAQEHGGFVLSSSAQTRRGTFVLRVPDRSFVATLAALGEIGVVEFEDQTGQDVTAEFVDLVARRKILLARKRVLLGFLRDADTVQETLDLYGRVEDTQLQLERIEGQLRFLRDQIAESTIRVTIRERAVEIATPQDIEKPSLAVAWERAVQGFLNVVAAVVIGLGYLVPVAAIASIGWLTIRLVRQRRIAT